MNEMLAKPPKWIIRSGSMLLFLVVLLLLGLAWFIRYPDEVVGQVVLTGSEAPVELTNQRYSQLKALYVEENQEVREGDVIAQFDAQADDKDMAKRNAYLNSLDSFNGHFKRSIPLPLETAPPEIFQEQWAALLARIETWNQEHAEPTAQDTPLKDRQQATEIQQTVHQLQSALITREKHTLWIAPCSGKIAFNKILRINRFYKANEASLVIVPKSSGYSALATITASGAGNVRAGQKVLIELADFPKAEFGVLEGRVLSITQVDKDGKYEVELSLPHPLSTGYHKQIPLKVQLKGRARIITKDRRLLERFFERLTDLMK